MSRGTPVTTVRLHPFVRSAIVEYVKRRNARKPKKPYTLSDFIDQACIDLLKKIDRADAYQARKKNSSLPEPLSDLFSEGGVIDLSDLNKENAE